MSLPSLSLAPALLVAFLASLPLRTSEARADANTEAPRAAVEDELVPRNARRAMQRLLVDIAELGAREPVEQFRAALLLLGDVPEDHAKLEPKWERALEEAETPPKERAVKTVERKLAKHLKSLEGRFEEESEERRRLLAEAVLLIDSTNALANETVGRVLEDGLWAEPEVHERRSRGKAVSALEQAARTRTVEISHDDSSNPTAQAISGAGAAVVEACGIHLHGGLRPERLEAVLREVIRALAFGRAVLGQDDDLPQAPRPIHLVLLETEADYAAMVEAAHDGGFISDEEYRVQTKERRRSFVDARGWRTSRWRTDADRQALVLWVAENMLYKRSAQPCLKAGFLNWLCLNFFGSTMPSVVWREAPPDPNETVGAGAKRDDPLRRSAASSMFGCRAWLRSKLEQGVQLPYSSTVVDAVGKVAGDKLLIATLVAEYLMLEEDLDDLLDETANRKDRVAAIEESLGLSLPEFDRQWQQWIVGSAIEPGVLQRIGGGPQTESDEEAVAVLQHLRQIRDAAFGALNIWTEPLEHYADLSAAAARHAKYLTLNEEQQTAWPAAHEEYADRPGFSASGARSGASSVIAFTGDGIRSIDQWMATFYHRLPLLHPGLCGIGYGSDQDVVVLDTGSLANNYWVETWVLWPPSAAVDVPRRFAPELPNPVPGEDQSNWGYPITVQAYWGQTRERRDLDLQLFRGKSIEGDPVQCHSITPHDPFFEEHAPANAWCLIPKFKLRANELYTVSASCAQTGQSTVWSFRTGG